MPDTQLNGRLDNIQRAINVIQAHQGNVAQWIQQLTRQIPKYVDEKQYLANGTQITLQPQSQNLQRITSMLAVVSSTGAVLTIGQRSFNLPIGITYWNNLTWLLDYNEPITLTQGSAGQLSLELMGEEIPTKGPF